MAVTNLKQKLMKAGFEAHEREIVKLAGGLGFTVNYHHSKGHVVIKSVKKLEEISTGEGLMIHFVRRLKRKWVLTKFINRRVIVMEDSNLNNFKQLQESVKSINEKLDNMNSQHYLSLRNEILLLSFMTSLGLGSKISTIISLSFGVISIVSLGFAINVYLESKQDIVTAIFGIFMCLLGVIMGIAVIYESVNLVKLKRIADKADKDMETLTALLKTEFSKFLNK